MDLNEVHQEILALIQEDILLVAAGYSASDTADSYERLSRNFQALAICHLLETADIGHYRENLIRSGYARRYFLEKMDLEGDRNNRRLALSRTEAFLDLIVAGQLELAKEIVNLSLDSWEASWEYEDDYCFYCFLHNMLRYIDGDVGNENLDKILDRYETVLEGGVDERLSVCRTLLSRDDKEFETALIELLETQEDTIDQQRERMLEPDPSTVGFWPKSFVSIEGLALIQFANIVGMDIKKSFPLCPDIGQLSKTEVIFPDFFREIEAQI